MDKQQGFAPILIILAVAAIAGVILLVGQGKLSSIIKLETPIASVTPNQSNYDTNFADCAPSNIKLSDIVVTYNSRNKITVQQTLSNMAAKCDSANKLVDSSNKEIRFYQLVGCWGNPPANYLELQKKQNDEIDALKKQYTVILMPCSQSNVLFY